MTPAATDLARRLAAHPQFRWAPGMRAAGEDPRRVVGVATSRAGTPWVVTAWEHQHGDESDMTVGYAPEHMGIPDLSDAATAGVLLAMLPGAGWSCEQRLGRWCVWHTGDGGGGQRAGDTVGPRGIGVTLGEACASALLAVWGPA